MGCDRGQLFQYFCWSLLYNERLCSPLGRKDVSPHHVISASVALVGLTTHIRKNSDANLPICPDSISHMHASYHCQQNAPISWSGCLLLDAASFLFNQWNMHIQWLDLTRNEAWQEHNTMHIQISPKIIMLVVILVSRSVSWTGCQIKLRNVFKGTIRC